MRRTIEHQNWMLLGTAPPSKDIWGLRRIEFPCGYYIPPVAFSAHDQPLKRPSRGGNDVWVMAGFAAEISMEGKGIPREQAINYLAGYRPWMALFKDVLLDQLNQKGHQITVWDQGVSIFYGLWQESCQCLGNKISSGVTRQLFGEPVNIVIDGKNNYTGVAAQEYAHDATEVIHFMSQFMTLSPEDTYILGPLAACRVSDEAEHAMMKVGNFSFGVALQ